MNKAERDAFRARTAAQIDALEWVWEMMSSDPDYEADTLFSRIAELKLGLHRIEYSRCDCASEPGIIINGVPLTHGQGVTLRVALNSFLISTADQGLGDDEHGIMMAQAYTSRVSEILALMYPKKAGKETHDA